MKTSKLSYVVIITLLFSVTNSWSHDKTKIINSGNFKMYYSSACPNTSSSGSIAAGGELSFDGKGATNDYIYLACNEASTTNYLRYIKCSNQGKHKCKCSGNGKKTTPTC